MTPDRVSDVERIRHEALALDVAATERYRPLMLTTAIVAEPSLLVVTSPVSATVCVM